MSPCNCESYLRIRRHKGLIWKTQYVVLKGTQLYFYASKQDAKRRDKNMMEKIEIIGGRYQDRIDRSLCFDVMIHGIQRQIYAKTLGHADAMKWVSAFYNISLQNVVVHRTRAVSADILSTSYLSQSSPVQTVQLQRRKSVSFEPTVVVQIITSLPYTPDQLQELFYTKDEIHQFTSERKRGSTLLKSLREWTV